MPILLLLIILTMFSGISIDSDEQVEAMVLVIISASRSTDLLAFYAWWFVNRLEKGYDMILSTGVYFFPEYPGGGVLDQKSGFVDAVPAGIG